jgi:hypothetical protein
MCMGRLGAHPTSILFYSVGGGGGLMRMFNILLCTRKYHYLNSRKNYRIIVLASAKF